MYYLLQLFGVWSFRRLHWKEVEITKVIGFLWHDNARGHVSTISVEHFHHVLCLWCLVWCHSRDLVGHGRHGVFSAHFATSLGGTLAEVCITVSPRSERNSHP